MSTLEATIDVVERLSEENLVKLQHIAQQLLIGQEHSQDTMTKAQFLNELEISREQAAAGKYRDAKMAVCEMRSKYGL